MVNTCCNSHTGLHLPLSTWLCMELHLEYAVHLRHILAAVVLQLFSGQEEGEMKTLGYAYQTNAEIYIPMDEQEASHTHICYQDTMWIRNEGERGEINWCFSQEEKEDCALKIRSGVALLQSIFGARFPPRFTPNATLFWDFLFFILHLSHWYTVCSYQRHNKCADFVLCSSFLYSSSTLTLPMLSWHRIIHY